MAGKYIVDNQSVKSALELLKSHGNEQVKQHIALDSAGRAKYVFTTYVGAGEGDPCMVDEYVYASPTSTQIIGRQERVYAWKASWDSGFVFDPSTDYDLDGNGVL